MNDTTSVTPPAKDPFDLLLDASGNQELWVLIGGPLAFLLLIVIVYAIVIAVRNKRERASLKKVIEDETKGVTTDLPPADDDDDAGLDKPYDVPEELRVATTSRPPKLAVIKKPEPVAEPGVAADVAEVRDVTRTSWLARLGAGLTKTRDALRASLGSMFTGKIKIDEAVLERLHEALYRADVGVATADKLVEHVRATLGREEAADWNAVSTCLKERALSLFQQGVKPVNEPPPGQPFVVLIVGVNGVGKTTSIGKLAAHFLAADKKVLLCAADTFRAAAIDQLQVWGDRLGVDVVKHKQGADPAAVAYDGVKAAIARKADVLLIDTAGRLHNKAELMDELGKVNRVIGKDLPGAPHETWLVLDATTGQNAVVQVKAFREVVGITGLVVTKLDGTAKGGVLIGIADQFGLPLRYVGVGEKAADLRGFEAKDFVESLF